MTGSRRSAGLGLAWFGAVGLVVTALAGCTADDGFEIPEPTVTPAPTPTPTPTEDPSPEPGADGPMDRSDTDLGIVFHDLPAVSGDARAALDVLTLFQVEFWRALSSGEIDPLMSTLAAPEVVSVVQAQLDGNASGGWTLLGPVSVTPSIDEATEHVAVGSVCLDYSEGLFVNDGITHTAAEVEMDEGLLADTELAKDSGRWVVTGWEATGTC